LTNRANLVTVPQVDDLRTAARALGLEFEIFDARNAGEVEVDAALREIPWKAVGGLQVGGDAMLIPRGAKIAQAVRAAKIPAIFPWRDYHDYGVVMSYGPNLRDVLRRGAYYVDRLLKGAKPSDLPVEQVSKIELIIDLRAARSMGIRVPQTLLYRADQVIR
jgi:putative ABC transport system substrate-binding protein